MRRDTGLLHWIMHRSFIGSTIRGKGIAGVPCLHGRAAGLAVAHKAGLAGAHHQLTKRVQEAADHGARGVNVAGEGIRGSRVDRDDDNDAVERRVAKPWRDGPVGLDH